MYQPELPRTIEEPALLEASGLVASRAHPGLFYTHNDGDDARVFVVDEGGVVRATWAPSGVTTRDLEDIAIGPASGGGDAIYLADIGDNPARTGDGTPRDDVAVIRVPEPADPVAATAPVAGAETLRLQYPDRPHDAEALIVVPGSGDLIIITKEDDGRSRVFQAAAGLDGLPFGGEPLTLDLLGEIQIDEAIGAPSRLVTAADVAPSGDGILVRTYFALLRYSRPPGRTLPEALFTAPELLPVDFEPQGEAVATLAGEDGYATVSEGLNPSLFVHRCR